MKFFPFHNIRASKTKSLPIRPLRDWTIMIFAAFLILVAFAVEGVEAYRGMVEDVGSSAPAATPTFDAAKLSAAAGAVAQRADNLASLQAEGSGIADPSK